MSEPSTDERETAEVLGFIERWVKRYAKPAGDRHILLAKISTLRALVARPAVDVEVIARVLAEFVHNGVCLVCGGAVLESGEHIEPERHATEVAAILEGRTDSLAARPAVDVEGIARVLDEHRLAPIDEHRDWTCRCGVTIALAGLHLDLRALTIRHQAQAVVAYLAGEGR